MKSVYGSAGDDSSLGVGQYDPCLSVFGRNLIGRENSIVLSIVLRHWNEQWAIVYCNRLAKRTIDRRREQ